MQFLEIPETCPCCGMPTEIKQEINSGVYTLWCTNPDCLAKGNSTLKHFVKRDCMNIDGISGAKLEQLVNAGLITDFASIYRLNQHKDEIIELEGFGEKSYDNLIQAIDKSRIVYPHNLLFALGIPNVGLATAKLVCEHYNNDLSELIGADYTELTTIDGVGDTIAESLISYFSNEELMAQLTDLVYELKVVKPKAQTNNTMAGITICVTGDVYQFSSRRVVKETIESLGGKLTGSVSRSTSYLVTNDTTSGSNKNKKAKEYGISILTEEQFIEKFGLKGYIH